MNIYIYTYVYIYVYGTHIYIQHIYYISYPLSLQIRFVIAGPTRSHRAMALRRHDDFTVPVPWEGEGGAPGPSNGGRWDIHGWGIYGEGYPLFMGIYEET